MMINSCNTITYSAINTISIVFFLTYTIQCYSQDSRYQIFNPKFKSEILDSTNIKKFKESNILRDLTFAGAYQELYTRDFYSEPLDHSIKEIISDSEKINAKDYILKRASEEQIVIINESHHRPEHRVFTTSLLEELYNLGFRYLALEAINSNALQYITSYPDNLNYLGDSTIMTRGYPLMMSCSGTYVKEPQFGNMIRKAIKLGFQIIGYEQLKGNRELNQATNISNILKRDSNAKILVHCGYGHLIESPVIRKNGKQVTLMGGYLRKLTGVDPFTINQTAYYYNAEFAKILFIEKDNKEIIALKTKTGEMLRSFNENEQRWDLTIFHPDYTDFKKRPSWLTSNSKNKKFTIYGDSIFIDFPVRLKLLDSEDRFEAVPIDIIESDARKKTYTLYGEIEDGKIIIENPNGDRLVVRQKGQSRN